MSNIVYGVLDYFPELQELQSLAPFGSTLSKVTTGAEYHHLLLEYTPAVTLPETAKAKQVAAETYESTKARFDRHLVLMRRVRIRRFICLGLVAGLFAAAGFACRTFL